MQAGRSIPSDARGDRIHSLLLLLLLAVGAAHLVAEVAIA